MSQHSLDLGKFSDRATALSEAVCARWMEAARNDGADVDDVGMEIVVVATTFSYELFRTVVNLGSQRQRLRGLIRDRTPVDDREWSVLFAPVVQSYERQYGCADDRRDNLLSVTTQYMDHFHGTVTSDPQVRLMVVAALNEMSGHR